MLLTREEPDDSEKKDMAEVIYQDPVQEIRDSGRHKTYFRFDAIE